MKKYSFKLLALTTVVSFLGCKAFMEGYTWSKAENSYNLVTGDKDNFGDKRLVYIEGYRRNSALANFLDCKCNYRGRPDFIYEYKTDTKCRGIKFFYVKIDSAFVFEEPRKNHVNSIQKEARKMDDYERQTYERLKQKK